MPVRNKFGMAGLLAGLLLIAACASAPDYVSKGELDEGFLRARAVSKVEDGIRVSAAFPTYEEARSIFGIDFSEHDIRPLWLEVENRGSAPFLFLPTGLDPEYFAPYEAAFLYKSAYNHMTLGRHLEALSFDGRTAIPPGGKESGFVYVNAVEPNLLAQVDLFGWRWNRRISIIVPVPDTDVPRISVAALRAIYKPSDMIDIRREPDLRRALEQLPCCVTDESGARQGLPLNLVLIGTLEEMGPAFVLQGYNHNPASPLYLFGRKNDLSARKRSRWVSPQPHVVRVWLTPLRYQGAPVWVAQVSTAQGGRFAVAAGEAQAVDPAVDEPRNDVLQDLLYSQSVARIGFVGGAGREGSGEPSYRSSGQRAVLLFTSKAVSLLEIGFFDWETLRVTTSNMPRPSLP